jgi:hypothetical protein
MYPLPNYHKRAVDKFGNRLAIVTRAHQNGLYSFMMACLKVSTLGSAKRRSKISKVSKSNGGDLVA